MRVTLIFTQTLCNNVTYLRLVLRFISEILMLYMYMYAVVSDKPHMYNIGAFTCISQFVELMIQLTIQATKRDHNCHNVIVLEAGVIFLAGGSRKKVKLAMPEFPHKFSGTGDLFTALLLAWLHKHPVDLKVWGFL